MNASISRPRRSALTTGIAVAAFLVAFGLVSVLGAFSETPETHDRSAPRPTVRPTVAKLAASYATDWRAPSDARLALEAHTDLLSRIATAHGGGVRIVSTTSTLRTRSANGARLAQPLALFERTFELHLGTPGDAPALLATLADARFRVVDLSGQARAGETQDPRLPGIEPIEAAIRIAGDR